MPYSGSYRRYEGPPPGTYQAILADVQAVKMRVFQSEETEPGVRFSFKIYAVDSRGVSKEYSSNLDCRNILSSRSKLFATLQSMTGKLPEDVKGSDGALTKTINSLIGGEYIVTVEVSETGYSKITNVVRMPAKAGPRTRQAIVDAETADAVTGEELNVPEFNATDNKPPMPKSWDDSEDIPF